MSFALRPNSGSRDNRVNPSISSYRLGMGATALRVVDAILTGRPLARQKSSTPCLPTLVLDQHEDPVPDPRLRRRSDREIGPLRTEGRNWSKETRRSAPSFKRLVFVMPKQRK